MRQRRDLEAGIKSQESRKLLFAFTVAYRPLPTLPYSVSSYKLAVRTPLITANC